MAKQRDENEEGAVPVVGDDDSSSDEEEDDSDSDNDDDNSTSSDSSPCRGQVIMVLATRTSLRIQKRIPLTSAPHLSADDRHAPVHLSQQDCLGRHGIDLWCCSMCALPKSFTSLRVYHHHQQRLQQWNNLLQSTLLLWAHPLAWCT